MKLTKTRKTVGTAALAIGLLVGGAGVGAAATGNFPTQNEGSDGPEQSYASSIHVVDGAKTDGLAKIQADQAASAAATAAGGTAGKPSLENEHGNVIYDVEVTRTSGEVVDVIVDAGNGSILAQEAGDVESKDGPGNE